MAAGRRSVFRVGEKARGPLVPRGYPVPYIATANCQSLQRELERLARRVDMLERELATLRERQEQHKCPNCT